MQRSHLYTYHSIFSNCHRIVGTETWGRIRAALEENARPENFPEHLHSLKRDISIPAFLVDLSRLEWAIYQTGKNATVFPESVEAVTVNPSLKLLPVAWNRLPEIVRAGETGPDFLPEPASAHLMVWRHPVGSELRVREAGDIDLLALKLIVEGIDAREAAAAGNVSVAAIDAAVQRAVKEGLLIAPESGIRRELSTARTSNDGIKPFLVADAFTLQWHITQECDLHCRHCYDRSDRTPLAPEAAIAVLDDFYAFCRQMHVRGQVTFTGGNPLMYPDIVSIYRAASDRGFGIAILGNPTPIREIERLMEISKPLYFQISLEGLKAHNDYIRGEGHFQRSLAFLDQLRGLGIYTMVMLTLTRDNLDQVFPLGELLQERADFFTFNRLSTVGEGAQLKMPHPKDYEAFLRQYEAAATTRPIFGIKDNLINIIRQEKGLVPFGGCTGYGCGAAFNFVALLPDGEVHACRKFPSPIGNILERPLAEIYHSKRAAAYRSGSEACRECSLYVVCRGCLAIAFSHGLDITKEKDPFCFIFEGCSIK